MRRIIVEELGKTFRLRKEDRIKEVDALRGVSFSVEEGETVGLVGHAKSGKSTLLRIVGGISRPTSGRVIGRGRVVPLIELGTVFVDDYTGVENVLLQSSFFGIPRDVATRNLDALFEFAGLERFRDVAIGKYSSGMYLRFAFAAAVSLEPEILLADSVFGVGDLDFQERSLRRIQGLGATGTSTLLVSPEPAVLLRLCDRVIWLADGELVADGPAVEVIPEYLHSPAAIAGDYSKRILKGSDSSYYGEIADVQVKGPSGGAGADLNAAEPIRISVMCHILRASSMRCSLKLFARGQLAVHIIQPEETTVDTPGKVLFETTLPPNMLTNTIYAVTTELVFGKRAILSRSQLSFSVRRDHAAPAHGDWPPFVALVDPQLEWSVRQEGE